MDTLGKTPVTRASALSQRWTALANSQRLVGWLFVAPAVAVLLFVVAYPFLSAVVLSFQDKYVGAPARWIGLGNYRELFGDAVFFRVIRNTFVYTLFAVGLKFALGLGMALVLSQPRRFNSLYRTILFIPWAVPTLVSALNFRWVFDDFSGLLNTFLVGALGFQNVISWLGDPDLAMGSVISVVVWSGTPFYTMSFLAGLQAIPRELYEAAKIDGCSAIQEFWSITVPQMRNVFSVVVMLSTIWTSTNLVVVLVLTNGGPANRTQILPNLAYKYALFASRMGIGSAVNMVFFPLLAVFVVFLTRRMLSERER